MPQLRRRSSGMISAVIGVRLLVGLAIVPVLAAPAVQPEPPPTRDQHDARRRRRTASTTAPTTTTIVDHDHVVASTTSTTTTTTTTTLPPLPTIPAASWARFDELVAGQLTGRGDRAAAVAVSVDGRLVHAAAFGTRTPDDPLDVVTTTDRFRIASISKVVTATVVLQLVDAGFLQLDEPVGQRLADVVGVAAGNGVAAVTVRQLLSHTSGFPDYRGEFFGDRFTSCEAGGRVRAGAFVGPPAGDDPRLQQPQLLPARLARRRRHRQVVRGRGEPDCCCSRSGSPACDSSPRSTPTPTRSSTCPAPSARTCSRSAGPGPGSATPSDMVRILDSLDPASPWLASASAGAVDADAPSRSTSPTPSRRNGATGSASSSGRTGRGGTPAPSRTPTRCSSAGPTA